MRSEYKILSYNPNDKISDLIFDDYHMLLVLNRFGINLGFKDQTIGEVCAASGIDTATFIAIVNLLAAKSIRNINLRSLSLQALVDYLSKSHTYFLEYKLPFIRKQLKEAIADDGVLAAAVMNYYDEYVEDIRKHMDYEESTVFSYVRNMAECNSGKGFHIGMFSEHHEAMEASLSELKNIIIKYYPTATTNQLSSVLFELFACEKDISSHGEIEDCLLIPAICELEQNKKS